MASALRAYCEFGVVCNPSPQTTGFSVRNLKYMKKFSGLFTEDDIDQMGFAGLTWYHHMALMDKTDDREHYLWYLSKAMENGWTRDVLAM